MPAFIGLPGARETVEKGRGLFERSEFRSPRRRSKRKAGIPDNERATFLGNFFAAGKKLQYAVILKGFALKNLRPSKYLYEIPRRAVALARNDMIVILNGTKWNEESLAKRAYGMRSLTFVRDDIDKRCNPYDVMSF